MPTLTVSKHGDNDPFVLGIDRASFNQGQNAKFNFSVYDDLQPTLTAKGPGAVATDNWSIMSSGLQGCQQSDGGTKQDNSHGGGH